MHGESTKTKKYSSWQNVLFETDPSCEILPFYDDSDSPTITSTSTFPSAIDEQNHYVSSIHTNSKNATFVLRLTSELSIHSMKCNDHFLSWLRSNNVSICQTNICSPKTTSQHLYISMNFVKSSMYFLTGLPIHLISNQLPSFKNRVMMFMWWRGIFWCVEWHNRFNIYLIMILKCL